MLSTGEVGGLRAEARAALGDIESVRRRAAAPASRLRSFDAPPAVGDRVLVATFGAEGIVRGVSGKRSRCRSARQTDARSAVGAAKAWRQKAPARRPGPMRRKGTAVRLATAGLVAGPRARLVLIGSDRRRCGARVEKFLDDALLADERRLRDRARTRHGTAARRAAVILQKHPLVASVAPAADNEGGDGATIVELKD